MTSVSGLPSDAAGVRGITFATWLHDTVPMPDAIAGRLRALEGDVSPTLSELRAALGFGLDLSDVWAAYEGRAADFMRSQEDASLAALLDALWRAVRGTRVVQARISAGGDPQAARERGPIALREGERLALLVVASNETDADAEFSAEARGEGIGMAVARRRAGALLLDAGPLPAGSYLLPLMLVANGRVTTLDLPIECAASGTLTVRIVDDASGEPVAARVYCADDAGPVAPAGVTLRRDRHGNAWFHAEGGFEATAAGRARVRVVRGIEYEPVELGVSVRSEALTAEDVRLRRWSHMEADGWRSGDVHVHLHYGGELALTPEDAALAQRAEDLHVLHMMVANCNDGARVLDREFFAGAPHALSDGEHILQWGEEFRNALYGHMCLFGIDALAEPICTGVAFSAHPHDSPANAAIAASARAAGGTVSYAHPVLEDSIDLDRMFSVARTVEAKELPVDAALGRIDAVDIMSYPGKDMDTARLWYRLLNCGLRLAATAGTDTFMNMDDSSELLAMHSRCFSSPPGGARVFVRVDGGLTTGAWCAGVRRGETFVTNAPMLDLRVNGRGIGSELRVRAGDALRVEASAGSYAPMERIELVINGEAVASADATDGGRYARLTHEVVTRESCWVALRAMGPVHDLVLGDALFAHTSPIYVTVDGAPVARAEDAAYFVEWIERLIAMTRAEGRFVSEAQMDDVLAVFREGQAYYRARARQGAR
ncbi:MAG: CehA/McbA family metallohydrolase [Chloroflexota bacterium]|nr:CehA/McbA family metallohydrolase [Chloroflexota bacterium]